MWDIVIGAVAIVAGSLLLVLFGYGLARRCSPRVMQWVVAIVAGELLVFSLFIHGTLLMARVIPFSNAIVLGNWIPVGAGWLAGVLLGQQHLPQWRRTALAVLLLSVSWYSLLPALLPARPVSTHRWFVNGICLQSDEVSCAPACAATLLTQHGIKAGEQEMLSLCLTTPRGTPTLGIYRGLKLKTAGSRWQVAIVHGSLEQLCRTHNSPILLRIQLAEFEPQSCLRKALGIQRRYEHAVIMSGRTYGGLPIIHDPASKVATHYSIEDLNRSWCGEGLQLVPRGNDER